MNTLRILILLVWLTSVLACSTLMGRSKNAVVIHELDYSLTSLRAIASASLPVGLATVSSNGREFTSNRFVIKRNKYQSASDATSRYFAKITLLGDRQPYEVEVVVFHEKRIWDGQKSIYKVVAESRYLSEKVAYEFRDQLTKRREDPNIIDDFRVF